ncbi:MAG: NnrU protein [Alphaproteobacteria bacterium]|nr:NnrU protein [Alphaproteobacteria bacterium]
MNLTGTMMHLAAAAALFVGIHVVVSGTPLRAALVRAIGERAYLAAFSVASGAVIFWMVAAYNRAPSLPLWQVPAFAWIAIVVMPVALFLFVAAFTARNPTVVGVPTPRPESIPGVFRITRHPFMWSVTLWSAAHLFANGDLASLVFFGALLLLSLVGPFLIDAKRRAKDPEAWVRFAAVTSNVPLAALLAGRARVTWAELGWWRFAIAAIAYAALVHFHASLIGVPVR